MEDNRPKLNNTITPQDFKAFYWLKEELIKFCIKEGLLTNGGKIEISNRIEKYLITGQKTKRTANGKLKSVSKFNWNHEELTLRTVITDNYKNSENVRAFFTNKIGRRFKFNAKFMNWMKTNIGLTLENAMEAWKVIVEHPYGTIKRQWSFDHITTKKTKQRASADVGFMFIAYNLTRIWNILRETNTSIFEAYKFFIAFIESPLRCLEVFCEQKSKNQIQAHH